MRIILSTRQRENCIGAKQKLKTLRPFHTEYLASKEGKNDFCANTIHCVRV